MDHLEDTDIVELTSQLQAILDDPKIFGNWPAKERIRVIARQMHHSDLLCDTRHAPPIPQNLDQLWPVQQ